MTTEEREALAFAAGIHYAAMYLRYGEEKTIGHADAGEAIAWHRRNFSDRLVQEAARVRSSVGKRT